MHELYFECALLTGKLEKATHALAMEAETAEDVAVAAWELAAEFDIADEVTDPPVHRVEY